jgi:hypothetical protein
MAYDVIGHPGPNNEDLFIGAPDPTYLDPENVKLVNGQLYHLTADGWKFMIPAQFVAGFVNNVLKSPQP